MIIDDYAVVMRSSEPASAPLTKRHRSLEDLQTSGICEEEAEEDASDGVTSLLVGGEKKSLAGKSSRGCGANESFRAAIDRSYDLDSTDATDPRGMTVSSCVFRILFTVLRRFMHRL